MLKLTRMTAAQVLVEYLIHRKIPYVIGIHGHGDMCLGEALAERKDEITFIACKNEQYGGLAAVAYAKMTGKPLAVVTSTGPGSTNLATVAATAYTNRLPVLLIPGDTFASGIGPALQQIEGHGDTEMRATDTLKAVSRYFVRINRVEQLKKRLPEAFIAMLKPGEEGPAVIAMPMDVQAEAHDFDLEMLLRYRHTEWERIAPSNTAVILAADVLHEAKRPIIIAGGGVIKSGAWEKLAQLAVFLDAPVVHTQAGNGALLSEHPLNAFSAGVTGTSCGNTLAKKADVIIGVGTRYTDFTTCSDTLFDRGAVFVNVNISPFDVAKQGAIGVWGDAKTALSEILKYLEQLQQVDEKLSKRLYRKEIDYLRQEWIQESNRLRALGGVPMTQSEVIGIINDFVSDDAVIIASAGSLPGDLQKLWRCKDPTRKGYHLEYGYSAMGYEVAGGLGVKLADPSRDVYVLVGDGSFLMAHQELITAVQERIAFTVVLFDNGEHRSIRGCQEGNSFEVFGTQLRMRDKKTNTLSGNRVPVNFLDLASGCGCIALHTETGNEFIGALEKAREVTDRPTVIHVPIDPERVVGNYGGWWDVPRPEVSKRRELQKARQQHERDKMEQVVR